MRGFLGLINQATFCLGPETRKAMENLKDKMKSKNAWSWTEQNQNDFNELKKLLVKDCSKGIYRLTSSRESHLALISDWSKNWSGYTLYEVTCKHPPEWDNTGDPKILCSSWQGEGLIVRQKQTMPRWKENSSALHQLYISQDTSPAGTQTSPVLQIISPSATCSTTIPDKSTTRGCQISNESATGLFFSAYTPEE